MIARSLIAAALLLCVGGARAADAIFHNIRWPRHDKTTGVLDWELRARTAEPAIASDQYTCTDPELVVYKLEEKDARMRTRKDLFLRADSGTYLHGQAKASAKLAGRVAIELYGEELTRLKTDEATIDTTWDKEKNVRTRTIKTRSRVTMESESRGLVGDGMTIFQRTIADGVEDKSMVTVHRNVTMELRGAATAGALPTIPGAERTAKETTEPVRITCLGPVAFDRLANVAAFHDQVALASAGTTLHCDALTLTFAQDQREERNKKAKKKSADKADKETKDKETKDKKAKDEKKPGPELKGVVAENNVAIIGKDQRFSGDRFVWDPAGKVGTLTGKPATMTGAGTRARAGKIELDQETQTVIYTGDAVVEIELKTE
ncbi:MAG: LPS export ABC transporter periplasmic protein LptC [Planctomycetota bacterium]